MADIDPALLVGGDYAAQLRQARELQNRAYQQQTAPIDPSQLEALARARSMRGLQDEGLGAMFQAEGPEETRPLGRTLSARGMQAREPWEVAGGIIQDGKYTADPSQTRERLTKALAAQAAAARQFAGDADTHQSHVLQRALQQQQIDAGKLIKITQDGRDLLYDTVNRRVIDPGAVAGGGAGGGAPPPKLTDSQTASVGYGRRIARADQVLDAIGPNYSAIGLNTKLGVEGLPGVGGVAGSIGNMMLSPQQQQVEQAQRDFINAVLRRESGAVISPSEFDNARKQYFPQPGDSPQVIAQKKANRRTVLENFYLGSGPGARFVAEAAAPQQQEQEQAGAGPTARPPVAQRAAGYMKPR